MVKFRKRGPFWSLKSTPDLCPLYALECPNCDASKLAISASITGIDDTYRARSPFYSRAQRIQIAEYGRSLNY